MIENEEILFSHEELKSIEYFAFRNPQFRDPFLMNTTKFPTDISKISPIHGLIFPKGNDHSGFDHIHKRHEQMTNTPKWIETTNALGNVEIRLQNQSLFRKDSTPFFDYCNIAESIYRMENLNIEKNKRPEVFEMYTGVYTHKDGTESKYNLLIYKGTKVVHTLYPQSNKNNPERVKGFHYSRGSVSASYESTNSVVTIEIPYLTHQQAIKYVLIIRRILPQNIEKAFVQVNDNSSNPWKSTYLGEREIDFKTQNLVLSQTELIKWQYADLRVLEKLILETEEADSMK